jgi:dTDP-4-amino-4,6-dideoxygalactose transaminase
VISYGRHDINDSDITAVVEVLRGDWLTTGPTVERFEAALAAWTGGVPTISVSSGTAALHTAYAAAGLGPGDEVITPPITFVATQAALMHLGATPVFADVEPDTALINPAAVEAAITPRTKAIVAVDYAGHPADLDALRTIADRHQLLLIEDAAHSLGSVYRGRSVGSLADITTFSFFPTKNITSGEGGAVASPHSDILDRARRFSRQGLVRDPSRFVITTEGAWHQEVQEIGLNYRLTDIHAALGLSQLSRVDEFRAKRAEIKGQYDEALGMIPDTEIPTQLRDVEPMWHLYPLRVLAERRREIFESLRRSGIGVQVNYLPAYRHPALTHLATPGEFPASEEFYSREISLPLHTGLTSEDVEMICMAVTSGVREL